MISEEYRDTGDTVVEVRLQNRDWHQLLSRAGVNEKSVRLDVGHA